MDFQVQDVQNLLLAALLGAIIGIDREYRGKPVGFRTLLLVSMGAALLAMVSFKMAMHDPNGNSDVTRIASNIIVGIGFLGAGIIFRTGEEVKGLTTATTIWISAAIGIAAGIGSYGLAIIATFVTWVTLFVLHYVEDLIEEKSLTTKYRVSWYAQDGNIVTCEDFFKGQLYRIEDKKIHKKGDLIVAEWTIKASRPTHEEAVQKMITDRRIVDLEY